MPEIPLTGAAALVRDFLAAMEARDLDGARRFLAPEFVMTFPGNVRMSDLQQLIDWAQSRYRHVTKRFSAFDVAGDVVWCHGTLSGAWPDGTGFDGIRFVDRFEIADGRLVRQDVWNDIAEMRP